MQTLKVLRLPKLLYFKTIKEAIDPYKGSEGAVGFDVSVPRGVQVELPSGSTTMVETGLEFHFAPEYELQVRSRSGVAYSGIQVANSPGTIDPDYTGTLKVLLYNSTNRRVVLEGGTRIAQVVLKERLDVELEEGRVSRETERGDGGFGSTG